jgi:hypothetical protein
LALLGIRALHLFFVRYCPSRVAFEETDSHVTCHANFTTVSCFAYWTTSADPGTPSAAQSRLEAAKADLDVTREAIARQLRTALDRVTYATKAQAQADVGAARGTCLRLPTSLCFRCCCVSVVFHYPLKQLRFANTRSQVLRLQTALLDARTQAQLVAAETDHSRHSLGAAAEAARLKLEAIESKLVGAIRWSTRVCRTLKSPRPPANQYVNGNELRLGFSNTTRNPEGILSHNNRMNSVYVYLAHDVAPAHSPTPPRPRTHPSKPPGPGSWTPPGVSWRQQRPGLPLCQPRPVRTAQVRCLSRERFCLSPV